MGQHYTSIGFNFNVLFAAIVRGFLYHVIKKNGRQNQLILVQHWAIVGRLYGPELITQLTYSGQ